MQKYVLRIKSSDEKGLIYRVADVVFKYRLNILKTDEFVDYENTQFFMRALLMGEVDELAFQGTLQAMLPPNAQIVFQKVKDKNIVILATKEAHCLGDLLIKSHSKQLKANIQAVVSNHEILEDLCKKFDLPFFYVDAKNKQREEHEAEVLGVLEKFNFDYLVLAKYMRILSPNFVSKFPQKIINIHHSFLPAFIGANPYKQAYERGVKIVGATAHFVNDNLDEGPIITQGTTPVTHEMSWMDMQQAGQNVEKVVLSNALDLVFDEKVFVHGNKTIVF